MSNMYSRQFDEMRYQSGDKIAFSLKIDREALSKLVYKASQTKAGRSKLCKGAFVIEAKRLS